MSTGAAVTLDAGIEQLTRALGEPVATPALVADGRGGLKRPAFRVWRWDCPVCRAGENDPDRIYRPLVLTSEGDVRCDACACSAAELRREIQFAIDCRELLEALEAL